MTRTHCYLIAILLALAVAVLVARPNTPSQQVRQISGDSLSIETLDPWVVFDQQTQSVRDTSAADLNASALHRGGRFRIHFDRDIPPFNKLALHIETANPLDLQDLVADEFSVTRPLTNLVSSVGRRITTSDSIIKEWISTDTDHDWQFVLPKGATIHIKAASLYQEDFMPQWGVWATFAVLSISAIAIGTLGLNALHPDSPQYGFRNLQVCTVHVVSVILLASLGHNFDLDSWEIVGSLVNDGQPVYTNTFRWPYGLPAASLLGKIMALHDWLRLGGRESFHMLVAGVLSLSNLWIAWLLSWKYDPRAGYVYLLLPTTLLITGFHSQIDTLAIALGVTGWMVYVERDGARSISTAAISCGLLAASICVKHIMLFLPLCWLLSRNFGSLRRRTLYVALAYGLFAGHFIVGVADMDGLNAVYRNVFQYRGWLLADNGLVPALVYGMTPAPYITFIKQSHIIDVAWVLILASVLMVGLRNVYSKTISLYLVAIVALSPTVANQYLCIPLYACCVYRNTVASRVFMAASSMWLIFSRHNIGALLPDISVATGISGTTLFASPRILQIILLVLLASILWDNRREACTTITSGSDDESAPSRSAPSDPAPIV